MLLTILLPDEREEDCMLNTQLMREDKQRRAQVAELACLLSSGDSVVCGKH